MNTTSHRHAHADLDALEARFAMRVSARLNEHAQAVSPDISERLRFAREQALARAASARQTAAPSLGRSGGSAVLGGGGGGWWFRVGSVLPLLALAGGLLLIDRMETNEQISVAAEVDTALLSDALPPTAYSDAGFVEFLKAPPNSN
jgi:Protein of unknown function (DUF3619)